MVGARLVRDYLPITRAAHASAVSDAIEKLKQIIMSDVPILRVRLGQPLGN
jgi:hypothetical protein